VFSIPRRKRLNRSPARAASGHPRRQDHRLHPMARRDKALRPSRRLLARGARRGQGRDAHQVQLQRAGRCPHRAEIRTGIAVISGIGELRSCPSCSLHDSVTAERLWFRLQRHDRAVCQRPRDDEPRARMPKYRFRNRPSVSSATDEELATMAARCSRRMALSAVAASDAKRMT